MDQKDFRAARIALEKGLATEAEVQACLERRVEEAKAGKVRRSIATMFVEDRIITPEQYTLLMGEMRRLTRERVEEFTPIGELLVESGALKQEQLDGALAEQARQPGRRVGEILLENGWVSYAQILDVLKVQEKTVLACGSCQAKYNVVRWRREVVYRCRHCGARLTEAVPAEDDGIATDASTRRLPAVGGPEETTRVVARPNELMESGMPVVVGKYVLLGRVFEGPFGTVHRAWQREAAENGTSIFILFLKRALDEKAERALFERVRKRAKGSNIALTAVVEVGEDGGKRFMAMR